MYKMINARIIIMIFFLAYSIFIPLSAQSGKQLEKVVFVRVYLLDFSDFDKMNRVYESYFSKEKLPARTCIGVNGLAVGASIEIDMIAKE